MLRVSFCFDRPRTESNNPEVCDCQLFLRSTRSTNTPKDANYNWIVCPSSDKIGLYSCGRRSRNIPQLARAAAI